ncbi:MAG: class II glutamine amidotransferase [Deltaproteobacteria bacterium]|nr:class II glutamine amidotransferase [Deltaproteobacteria bacterium]
MCRFTLYLGHPIRLSALLIEPSHSLILQSTSSKERDEPLNGDGFGVGWYAPELHPEPAVFRSITPAWNNRNLQSLARVVASPCIFAHVRAATQASGVNEANCHPFRYNQFLFMHNGDIGGFRKVRRKLLESVSDEAFGNVYGSTDSEHFFAVVIDELLQREESDPEHRMARALNRAIARVQALVDAHAGGEPTYLNVALTDGHTAVVARYSSERREKPESLYYYGGKIYVPVDHAAHVRDPATFVVASERLTEDASWQEIPPSHILSISRGNKPHLTPIDLALA